MQLNDVYVQMNVEQMDGQNDYLAMLSPPDYGNLASPAPQYVNDIIVPASKSSPQEPNSAEATGYLRMDIFSPKPADAVFDFDLHKKQKMNDESATGIELMPMLNGSSESDGELSPISATKSFANPSYHKAPIVTQKEEEIPKNDTIISNSDNYVNMPKQKSSLKNNSTCFSNPNYIGVDKKNEKDEDKNNYVNSQSRDWEKIG